METLSTEFYNDLYEKIISYGFEPEHEDDCSCNIEIEDFHNLFVSLKATFEVEYVDDSFDHLFGTEYGHHYEANVLSDIESVTLSDEDGNDVSKLFDYDKFFEQFKKYKMSFFSGWVLNSGDTFLAGGHYVNRWDEMKFLYYDTLQKKYVCLPVGVEDNGYNRRSYYKAKPIEK